MSDWDAERYHRVSNPQLEWGRRVLRRLAPQPGERILDIGCGTGRLTAELVSALGEGTVVAVDRFGDDAARSFGTSGQPPGRIGWPRIGVDPRAGSGLLRPCRRRGAAVCRCVRRRAEHGDVPLDPRPPPALREHLPGACAGRPARRAVWRRRQPRPSARSCRRPCRVTRPCALLPRLAGTLGVRRRADHDRTAGPGGLHGD